MNPEKLPQENLEAIAETVPLSPAQRINARYEKILAKLQSDYDEAEKEKNLLFEMAGQCTEGEDVPEAVITEFIKKFDTLKRFQGEEGGSERQVRSMAMGSKNKWLKTNAEGKNFIDDDFSFAGQINVWSEYQQDRLTEIEDAKKFKQEELDDLYATH